MKIKFNGVLERVKTGGCSSCNRKRLSKHGFRTAKRYILPSGQTMTFRVGVVTEVSEQDGNFLLSYNYDDVNGHRRAVFERVE